jgi:amino acid permease
LEAAPEITPEPGIEPVAAGDEGYQPSLAGRQVQMIAIGGAIGVGLFYGTGPYTKALRPVIARPTTSVLISRVPS